MIESRESYCHKHRVPFFGPPCITENVASMHLEYPWTIHPSAKVSEEVNRKFPPNSTTEQLSNPYTDPERHNAQRHRRTDDSTTPVADRTV